MGLGDAEDSKRGATGKRALQSCCEADISQCIRGSWRLHGSLLHVHSEKDSVAVRFIQKN